MLSSSLSEQCLCPMMREDVPIFRLKTIHYVTEQKCTLLGETLSLFKNGHGEHSIVMYFIRRQKILYFYPKKLQQNINKILSVIHAQRHV